jgi:hypothetical protein
MSYQKHLQAFKEKHVGQAAWSPTPDAVHLQTTVTEHKP